MTELIANALEDELVDSLNYKLKKTATYITNRRSCTFHPQGGNIYSSNNGVKLLKFLITGQDWLDQTTFRIKFDLRNEEASGNGKNLYPIGGPWTFFSRMRILAGGQVIEDIDSFNRISEMVEIFSATENRQNNNIEGFSNTWGNLTGKETLNRQNLTGIPPQQSMSILFKPISGLLSQKNFIPLRFCPLTIELSLVDSQTDTIITSSTNPPNPIPATDYNFYNSIVSNTWSIINPQVKCDLITLDSTIEEEYYQRMKDGGSLEINYNTFINQVQSVSGQSKILVNVSRSLTRLKSIFVSFHKDYGTGRADLVGSRYWNDFYSPMFWDDSVAQLFNPKGEFEFQVQVGSKLFPEYPITSHSEAAYQLKKCLGVRANEVHNFDITNQDYRFDKMILGIDCEKYLSAGFTGLSTRSGDLLTCKFNLVDTDTGLPGSTGAAGTSRSPDRIYIVLHSDHILQIGDTGVRVLD